MVLGDCNRFLFRNYVMKLKDKEMVELPRLENRVNIKIEYKRKNRFINKDNNKKEMKKGCLIMLENNYFIND